MIGPNWGSLLTSCSIISKKKFFDRGSTLTQEKHPEVTQLFKKITNICGDNTLVCLKRGNQKRGLLRFRQKVLFQKIRTFSISQNSTFPKNEDFYRFFQPLSFHEVFVLPTDLGIVLSDKQTKVDLMTCYNSWITVRIWDCEIISYYINKWTLPVDN